MQASTASIAVALLLCTVAVSNAQNFHDLFETRKFDLDTLVRFRCSLDSAEESMFYFNGSVFSYPEQQAQVHISKTTLALRQSTQ